MPTHRRLAVARLLLLAAIQGSLMTLSNLPAAAVSPEPAAAPEPPRAPARPHAMTLHGVTLTDPWHWLKDQSYPKVDDPDVLAYLTAENAWFEAWMAPRRARVDALFEELKARIKEDDASVPVRDGDYLYWRAFETGGQYRKWWRRPVAGGPDQLILDENETGAARLVGCVAEGVQLRRRPPGEETGWNVEAPQTQFTAREARHLRQRRTAPIT